MTRVKSGPGEKPAESPKIIPAMRKTAMISAGTEICGTFQMPASNPHFYNISDIIIIFQPLDFGLVFRSRPSPFPVRGSQEDIVHLASREIAKIASLLFL
jgi:hypothetical protein